jgi:hypothetical protein
MMKGSLIQRTQFMHVRALSGRACATQITRFGHNPADEAEGWVVDHNGGSRVLAVTSDRDTALQMLESTSDLIAESVLRGISLLKGAWALRLPGYARGRRGVVGAVPRHCSSGLSTAPARVPPGSTALQVTFMEG